MRRALSRLLSISPTEAEFARRGFRGGTPAAREHIERIGTAFLHGYQTVLQETDSVSIVHRLENYDLDLRGFGYEGAAMALHLLDRLMRRRRFEDFIAHAGSDHIYMCYVGAGWAMARLPFSLTTSMARFDPLLRWLALDGYGFHQGYFHWRTAVTGSQSIPARVSGYGRRAFDQGLGRSLWFVDGHDVERIPLTVSRFACERRADLWAGVGLAATYAAGASPDALSDLRAAAGPHSRWLAQGAAFAAKARLRARNLSADNEQACRALCGLSAVQAASIVDRALSELPQDHSSVPVYETWRQQISERLHEERDENHATARISRGS